VNRHGLYSRDVGTQDAEESNAGRKGPEPIRSCLPCTSCQVNGHGDSVEAQRTSGESSTFFTTAPTGRLRPPHHRMPGVLPAADYAPWRHPGARDVERLQAILRPFLGERWRGRAPGGNSHRAPKIAREVIDWCWGGRRPALPRFRPRKHKQTHPKLPGCHPCEVDPIIPLSKGGKDDPSNMQWLSKDQQRDKTKRDLRP